jgi:hypothetical protein
MFILFLAERQSTPRRPFKQCEIEFGAVQVGQALSLSSFRMQSWYAKDRLNRLRKK